MCVFASRSVQQPTAAAGKPAYKGGHWKVWARDQAFAAEVERLGYRVLGRFLSEPGGCPWHPSRNWNANFRNVQVFPTGKGSPCWRSSHKKSTLPCITCFARAFGANVILSYPSRASRMAARAGQKTRASLWICNRAQVLFCGQNVFRTLHRVVSVKRQSISEISSGIWPIVCRPASNDECSGN